MKQRKVVFIATIVLTGSILISCFDNLSSEQNEHSNVISDLITPSELQADFRLLREALEMYHPDLYQYTPKSSMDSMATSIYTELDKEMTRIEYYRMLRPLISCIRNDHTVLSIGGNFEEWFNNEALLLPLSLYPRNDSLYVLIDGSNEYKIKEGSTILSINNKTAMDLYKEGRSFFSTDGYNVTLPDWRMARHISLYYALAYKAESSYDIRYIDREGEERQVNIQGIKRHTLLENLSDGRKYYKKEKGSFNMKVKDGIAIITIPTFLPHSERRFRNEINKMFKQIRNQNIEKLIIDVRGNGGGYFESAAEVLRHLISEPIQPFKYEYALVNKIEQPHHFKKGALKHFHKQRLKKLDSKFYSNAGKMKVKPHKNVYQGKIAILLDQLSASATADFLGMTKSYTTATHIGVESGGNPVAQVAVELPDFVLPNSGLSLQLPLFRTELNTTFTNIGHGLIPDIILQPSIHAILSGDDLQLKRAITFLNNMH